MTDAPKIPDGPYSQESALEDLPAIKHAEALFLNSQMDEAEAYCLKVDPNKERLYMVAGYGLIQCLNAFISYEDEDLQRALAEIKRGQAIASIHRAPPSSIAGRLAALVWTAPSVDALCAMTPVQRHAELLYAETLCAKAMAKIILSGSWLSCITEALSFRTMINIYMSLGAYVTACDAANPRGRDPSIDTDFRSGVELGVGASNLILSFLPNTMISIVELFGYKGDRNEGLALLMKAGGWSKESKEPNVVIAEEGLRRPLADLVLLCFHVIISGYTFRGVDLSIAQSIIDWNLRRFPNGVFFLFFSGRLNILRSKPMLALQQYNRALSAGSEHKSLTYIAFWEQAIAYLSLWDIPASLERWRVLEDQATWSKACYLYGVGVCLLQMGGEERRVEAAKVMERIEGSLQKVAGKSIPIEKFVARKARKFQSQNRRLLLPALEFSYMFQCISHAPRSVLVSRMLPEVDVALAQLNVYKSKPAAYGVVEGSGKGYFYDDLCLARFLEGVCARHVAFPDRDAIPEPEDDKTASAKLQIDASARALAAFENVLTNSDKIALDHYLIYHTHYEIGRLHACLGNQAKSREHLELVLSGKALEADPSARKGKYSMQTDLIMRATAALESLDEGGMR